MTVIVLGRIHDQYVHFELHSFACYGLRCNTQKICCFHDNTRLNFCLHDMQWFFSDRFYLLMHAASAWITKWVLINFSSSFNSIVVSVTLIGYGSSSVHSASIGKVEPVSSCCSICRNFYLATSDEFGAQLHDSSRPG